MKTPNLNKLFPRLTISAKLAIAFLLLAAVPVLAIGLLGLVSASRRLTERAQAALDYDLHLAWVRTTRSLTEVESDVGFLSEAVLRSVLEPDGADVERTTRLAETFLGTGASALFRVKVIDADGTLRLIAQRRDMTAALPRAGEAGEMFYLWTAAELGPTDRLLLPAEFRAGDDADSLSLLAAVAVLVPVYGPNQDFLGVVVGEALAHSLFAGLDEASPGMEGSTGLVDESGHFLYHSERKRDWSKLLADRSRISLATDFAPDVVQRILGADRGTLRTDGGEVVSFHRIGLGYGGGAPLVLYRTVPKSAITAPVRNFMRVFLASGSVILVLVLGSSTLAARQIARPVYRLRDAAARIARGESLGPLEIETNDEIEDLAGDFSTMARSLEAHRHELEQMVRERTRALESTRAQLDQVVTHSADAIVGLDRERRVQLWNRGAETLFGYPDAEAIGRRVDELLAPAGANPEEEAYLRRGMERAHAVVSYRTARMAAGGEEIPVSLTQSPILDDQQDLIGYSLILRDDRPQRNLDEQLRRSERMAAVSLMAAGLAHELNNPLAVLGNRIELMQRDALRTGADERLRRDLEVLRQHTGRIGAITSDLLRFARDDSDNFSRVLPNETAERVVRLLERMFVAAGIRLQTDLDPSSPAILASESALETVMVNLLLNAQHATPGGGTVTLRTRSMPAEETVHVIVEDTGPGIPEDIRGRIFEPFFTTKAERGGTGLGLAVCRALVDRHGGRIWADGQRGTGATFIASFPIHSESENG